MSTANEASASNAELERIYREANGVVDGKRAPLTTEAVFTAMRAAMATERERLAHVADSRTDGWCSLTADEIRKGAL